MKQTIDISPASVVPIAAAGIRFLSMETTLIPGNLKQQLAVLEVFLGGLAAGELMLATPPRAPVELDGKKGEDEVPAGEGPKTRAPTPEELDALTDPAGEGQSG